MSSHLNTNRNNLQSRIAVVIYSYNSQNDIVDCIHSAQLLTKHITLVDLSSEDKTRALAEKEGVVINSIPFSTYVEPARNLGIQQTKAEWVFILDADERITAELAAEIASRIQMNDYTYYRVPRKEFFAKTVWLRHGGWWPNYQIRLIQKTAFKGWPLQIHSTPNIEGEGGLLQSPLLHYSKNDYEDIVRKTINFEDIESDLLFKADKPVSTLTFFRKFLGELYRRLIKNHGYKDGTIGIIESVYQAYSKTITYLFLYEKKHSRTL